MQHSPRFRELDRAEIEEVLARNRVGRIGYTRGSDVEIQPVHYVFYEGWIYGRTSHGTKYRDLGATTHYQWWPVVFQVDEIEGPYDWRSILVRGGFYLIPEEGAQWERETWAVAVELLRSVAPYVLREDDPTPFRTVLFRIHVQDATGRAAETGG